MNTDKGAILRRRTVPGIGMRAVAVLGVAALLAGCSANGQDVPDGWAVATQGRLGVMVPETWVDGLASGIVDLVRQDVAGTEPGFRLAASSDYPDSSARGALGQVQTLNVLGTPDESGGMSEVEGDRDMWRWDLTTDQEAYHLIAWALCDKSPDQCALVTLVATGPIDGDMATTIQESIELA